MASLHARRRRWYALLATTVLVGASPGWAQNARDSAGRRATTQPRRAAAATRPAAPAAAASAPAARRHGELVVAAVVGGTLLRIGGEEQSVRLAGVLVPPGDSEALDRATAFLAALLEGEAVSIEEVPRIGRRGSRESDAGAVIAIVRRAPDGLCANIEAVRQGFARFDDDESLGMAAEFRTAELIARQARKGIWSDGAPRAPFSPPPPATVNTGSAGAGPSDAPTAVRKPGAKDTVYVTRTGMRYHVESCPSCRNGATAISLSEARARKLTPCSRCKPPQ